MTRSREGKREATETKYSFEQLDAILREMGGQNFYERLGVERTATSNAIKRAYREKIRIFHTDVNQKDSPGMVDLYKEISQLLNEAYDTLSDNYRKSQYDLGLRLAEDDRRRQEEEGARQRAEEEARRETGDANRWAPPETPEEERAARDTEGLAPEEKEKIGWGLGTLGFKIEKKKNDFFANALNMVIMDSAKSSGKDGAVKRFCKELRDSFVRDAEEARKKGVAIQEGKDKAGIRNFGLLVGNVLKYGRIVADVTGASIANPFRYVMMGGMITARAAEAGKEARLKNEKVIEKTRIDDIEKAQAEAFAIYEAAQAKEGKTGEETVSAETLKNTYLQSIPLDLQRRLEEPGTANGFIQKILSKQISLSVEKLQNKTLAIDSDRNLSLEQKETSKQKLFKKWEKTLADYDRIVTQYGTVDELAMAGRYTQTISKGVVLGMQIETAIVSIDKLFHAASNILSSHEIHTSTLGTEHASATHHTAPHTASPSGTHKVDIEPKHETVAPQTTGAHPGTAPVETAQVSSTPGTTHAVETGAAHPATVAPVETPHVNQDIVVHKGEGVEHAFIRQIAHNPKLAQDLGFKGDINDQQALHTFAQHEAHVVATETGYVDNAGHEVRVMEADKVAYEIKTENGVPIVTEKTLDGKILGTFYKGDEFGGNVDNQYEKVVNTGHHVASHAPAAETSTPNSPDTNASGEATAPTETPMQASGVSEPGRVNITPEEIARARVLENMSSNHHPANHDAGGENMVFGPQYRGPGPVWRGDQGGTNYAFYNGGHGAGDGGAIYAPGGYMEHGGQFYSDLSPENNYTLGLFPLFAENSFNLPGETLMHSLQAYQENIQHLFPGNKMGIWTHTLQNQRADKLLEHVDLTGNDQFSVFIHRLREYSGLRPENHLFTHEKIGHWIERAMQAAAANRNLDKLR